MFSRLAAILIIMSSFTVGATETNVLTLKPEIQRGDLRQPQGLWPFLGAGFGFMDHNDRIRTGGMPGHLKLVGSYNFETAPWIADAGIGMHNQFLTQGGSGSDSIQSLYTELAARYKLADRWQLGAIWNTLVDNPDRFRSNTENLASFVGVQVMKEFTYQDRYLLRAGGRAMTDVGISGETIDTVMAELQVSFGPERVAVVEEKPQPIAPHLARQVMSVDLSELADVNFETDSTRLVPSSQRYLKRLARALADNRHLFDKLQVVGHADQRGPDAYNQKLSERRALSITNSLVMAGVSKSQVLPSGRGENDLVSHSLSPMALLKNRRVQIEFQGVKNHAALKNVIDSVPQ